MNEPEVPAERVLWAAGTTTIATAAATWAGLHDQVMGGRSEGSAQPHAGDGVAPAHVLFSGQISTENGGGFASYRLRWPAPVVVGSARIALR